MKKNRITLILILIVFIAMLLVWYIGGRESSSAYIDINTGKQASNVEILFYRGIKIPKTPFVLFKRYYRIVKNDDALGCTYEIPFKKPGYNPFVAYYDNGVMAGQGYFRIEEYNDQILTNPDDVKEGEFYNPEGKLISCVKDGTGVATLFCVDGQKIWELHLKEYKRVRLIHWDMDGTLKLDKEY